MARSPTPFVAEIVMFDPFADISDDVKRVESFTDLADRSDIVTVHLPWTGETYHLVNEETLCSTKSDALLVNVRRGRLVDEKELADRLNAGRLAGAALDVLSDEPPVPSHPLLSPPNTILTPHVAWLSSRGQDRLQRWTVNAMLDVLHDRPLTHGRTAVAVSPIAANKEGES